MLTKAKHTGVKFTSNQTILNLTNSNNKSHTDSSKLCIHLNLLITKVPTLIHNKFQQN